MRKASEVPGFVRDITKTVQHYVPALESETNVKDASLRPKEVVEP